MNGEDFVAVLLLALLHFIGDFVLQSDTMAQQKSQNTRRGLIQLSLHAGAYSLPFVLFGLKFMAVTLVLHWITDLCTSRANAHYKTISNHLFFVGIGFDQLLHITTLILTLQTFRVFHL